MTRLPREALERVRAPEAEVFVSQASLLGDGDHRDPLPIAALWRHGDRAGVGVEAVRKKQELRGEDRSRYEALGAY